MSFDFRIGQGFDVHAFAPGSPGGLVLAGVVVSQDLRLTAHSDGDAVAHAVMDAMLGARALGDLGTRFGVGNPQSAGMDSMAALAELGAEFRADGWRLGNLDTTIVAQRPRLAEYQPAMRENLAEACGASPEDVSVKVTSTDGLGAIGRGEGIAVFVSVVLAGR